MEQLDAASKAAKGDAAGTDGDSALQMLNEVGDCLARLTPTAAPTLSAVQCRPGLDLIFHRPLHFYCSPPSSD